jgi:hypothetical protein
MEPLLCSVHMETHVLNRKNQNHMSTKKRNTVSMFDKYFLGVFFFLILKKRSEKKKKKKVVKQ